MFDKILDFVLRKEVIGPVIVLLVSWILYKIIKKVLKKFLDFRGKLEVKRKNTLFYLFKGIVKIVVIALDVLIILEIYGFDTKAIITSLSVIGVVVGLAFQDLIKSFIAGITIVLEGQYRVGDVIEIAGFKGEVIYLGLKSTKIKAATGEIKIISNHLVTDVINYSLSDSLAIVDVDVAYESDLDKVEKVLNKLCDRLTEELPKLKGEVTLLGINSLEASSVRYRMTVLTEPMEHFGVQRLMRKEIKLELAKNGIEIPYNQVVMHNKK